MTEIQEKILAISIGMIIGMGGTGLTVAWFKKDSHNGVYEIGFGETNTVNRFTIYKNRLHLMVALPVTGESGKIADVVKETKDAKNKSGIIPKITNRKDDSKTRKQR